MPPELVEPSLDRLPSYIAALRAAWSPNTERDVSGEQLAAIAADPAAFVADQAAHEGGAIRTADGSMVPRLPFRIRWIWDGAFCGSINLRYQPGTLDLPPYVSGHIGYAVVPWKRRRGYATHALRTMLPLARDARLDRVLVTCDVGNAASRGVILAAGGVPAEGGVSEGKWLFWIET